MRVLITDSNNRAALAATRSLGNRGHTVVTAGEEHPSLASVSRYSTYFERYPSPISDPERFAPVIADIARRHCIDVVLPMTEITTLLLAENQTALPSGCRLPFAEAQVIADASDKSFVVEAAKTLGVPTPETVVVQSAEEASALADRLRYPAVIKPARSRVRTPTGWLSTGVSYAKDRESFETAMTKLHQEEFPILVQERIHGPGVGVFACYNSGRPIAWFAHRRIREKPPSGGVSVLRESAPLDPVAVDYATRLLGRLGWHGVAMVEFKRDNRDGSLKLMEINGRFWGSLQLAIDAGVDFPGLLVDMAAGKAPQEPVGYRVGVRCRWFLGDLDALLTILRRSRSALNLGPEHPGRWRSLLAFLDFRARDEIFRKNDMRPWLLEARRWVSPRTR